MSIQVNELFRRTLTGTIDRTITTGMKDGVWHELTAVNTHHISSPINPFNDSWIKFDTTRKVTASISGVSNGFNDAVSGIETLGTKHHFDTVHLGEHPGENISILNLANPAEGHFGNLTKTLDPAAVNEIEIAARRISAYARGPRDPQF